MDDEIDDVIHEELGRHGKLAVAVTTIGDDDDLYRLGLTSHGTVSVMLALEERLDVELPDEALRRETFSSIRSIRAAFEVAVDSR